MALIKCPECNAEISDRAAKCIKCGFPLNKPSGGVAASRVSYLPVSGGAELKGFAVKPPFWKEPKVFVSVAAAFLLIAAIVAFVAKKRPEQAAAQSNQQSDGGGSNTLIDGRDGKTYKTAVIGDKRWMGENLNYLPPYGTSWCYDNNESNCNKYGRLYDWNTAMNACPFGWRLPSDNDWENLTTTVGSVTANKLKARSGWSDNGNGVDEYGFSALPGGNRIRKDKFENAGLGGFWWTATESGSGAYNRRMGHSSGYLVRYDNHAGNGYSVRCVKDD
jgi:uncharacterized protein (TIGR02145 family)